MPSGRRSSTNDDESGTCAGSQYAMSARRDDQQGSVDRYFDTHAGYWRNVYDDHGLRGIIYRRRMETALRWIDELGLSEGATALDVGCGAGLLAMELARRGVSVAAADSSSEMVTLTTRRAADAGLGMRISVTEADARRLPFQREEFSIVVALGLLPWLPDPGRAITEMARVLAPGGWIILTADNRARLNFLVEPRESPFLTHVRLVRRALRHAGGRAGERAHHHLHLPSEIDRMLLGSALMPVRRTTLGYGPFTFRGRTLLHERFGISLHRGLERSSAQYPSLLRTGWHYIVAAQKRAG